MGKFIPVSEVPEIMRIWGNNPDLDPTKIGIGSKERVNLKCPDCGHEWNRQITNVYRHHSECPVCRRVGRIIPVSESPSLMRFWNNPDINPQKTSVYSTEIVSWKCPDCNYEWQSQVFTRTTSRTNECPACAHLVASPSYNALTEYPDLSKYFDTDVSGNPPLETLLPTSLEEVHWHCPDCDHRWVQPLKERIRRHDGKHRVAKCPVCAGTAVKGVTANLVTEYPTIAAEWDFEKNGKGCEGIKSNSTANYWWKCELGHSYCIPPIERINDLHIGRTSCPYCDDRRVFPGLNSLKALYPHLMKEWDYTSNHLLVDPDKVGPGSKEDAWWTCSEGHVYKMRISHRVMFDFRGITACPVCKGQNRKRSHLYKHI